MKRGKKRSSQSELVPDLPPSDLLLDIMKPLLSDIQPGDLPLNPDCDQVIYFHKLRRSYRIPPMALSKTHFSHLFGLSQNKPSAVQIAIEQSTKCHLKGDFRVRTVELQATTKENAVAGWIKVLDEICRMPSLRPKDFILIDATTHKKVDEQSNVPIKKLEEEKKKAPQWGHIVPDLTDIFIDHLMRTRGIAKMQERVRGIAEVVLDENKRQIRITALTQENLLSAKATCLQMLKSTQDSIQQLYLSVSLSSDFVSVFLATFIPEDSTTSEEDVFAYLSLGEVVCSSEMPQKMMNLISIINPITGSVPVTINIKDFYYSGKEKKVDTIRFELVPDENLSEVTHLQRVVFDELQRAKETGKPWKKKLTLLVGLRNRCKLTLAPGEFTLPSGLESRTLCIGRPNEDPGIELALT